MGFAQLAVGAIGAVQVAQQGAIGKYNQAVANRNALVKEQEAQILDDKLNLELAQFDKSFRKLQGTQVVNTLKSGATFSGTARNIALSNLYEAEVEKITQRFNNSNKTGEDLEKIENEQRAIDTENDELSLNLLGNDDEPGEDMDGDEYWW